MYAFDVSVNVETPPSRVWRALCDPAEVVAWDTNVIEPLDAPADYPRPGQHVRWRYRNGPFRVLHDRPKEVVPEQRLRSLLALGPLRFDETYTLQPNSGGCLLTAAMLVWTPVPVAGALLDRLYAGPAAKTAVVASLSNIKRHCEGCEWEGCSEAGTHTDQLTFPDIHPERWTVCREHDRELKTTFVRSRQPLEASAGTPAITSVRCGTCKHPLEEPSDLPVEKREACVECGSTSREFHVVISETISVHSSLDLRGRHEKGGWFVKVKAGDDYTRDLKAWGKRELTMDRERNFYCELIELYDGSRLESVALLTDHHD